MNTDNRSTQAREVSAFDHLSLEVVNVENDLVIRQGSRHSLSLEGPADVLDRIETVNQDGHLRIRLRGRWTDRIRDALRTSLTRPRVRYIATVQDLAGLQISGQAHVDVFNIHTDRLAVRFSGIGDMDIMGLRAGQLEIDVLRSGPCRVDVTGQVDEQRVSLSGMTTYSAARLESHRARIAIKGPGMSEATLRVDDELDVSVGGPGRVQYYGNPQIRKKLSPLGALVQLGAS